DEGARRAKTAGGGVRYRTLKGFRESRRRAAAEAGASPHYSRDTEPARSVDSETMRSGPLLVAKNTAQAGDRARRPQWRRAAFCDGKPEQCFSGPWSGFRSDRTSRFSAFMNNAG